jgi:hypothetical protein
VSLVSFGAPTICPICGIQLFEKNDVETPEWAQKNFASRAQFRAVKLAKHWNAYDTHIQNVHPHFAVAEKSTWKYSATVSVVVITYLLALLLVPSFATWLFSSVLGIVSLLVCFFGIITLARNGPITTEGLARRYFIHKYSRIWNKEHPESVY